MRRLALGGWAAIAAILIGAAAKDDEPLQRRIDDACRRVTPSVIEWRRDLHAHPERSNREERTARTVAQLLREFGVDEVKTGVANHGVIGLIRGKLPGPTIGLRADMDALPIQEQTGLPFSSKNPGVMHACGHDAHTAMLLGASKVLCGLRDVLPGTVKVVFQPSEEGAPQGEVGGASLMIKEGVLKNPDVAAMFAMHTSPEDAVGKIAYCLGPIMASSDCFRITVKGKQTHAARPWAGIDPIVTASQIVLALQTIVSRKIDAREPVVVSVGQIHGGQAFNIIPETVTLEGTIRTFNADVRREVWKQIRLIATETAAASGAQAVLELSDGTPPLVNDAKLGRQLLPSLERVAGRDNLIETPPRMGAEDFAFYAEEVPSFFIFLGVRSPSTETAEPLHSPRMMVDEAALPIGVRIQVQAAVDYLKMGRE